MAEQNEERMNEIVQLLEAAVARIETLEAEMVELKTKSASTPAPTHAGRPGVFYKLLMVPKTGIAPQGKMLAKILSEIPPEKLREDGFIAHADALAAVEANLSRFKTVQPARRMLNYYIPGLVTLNALEVIE